MAEISKSLPQHAQVVIIGGGVIGCSVAYHLADMGLKDVVLIERDQLTSGTTWHAAGLMCTFGSTSEVNTAMRKYTRDLYTRLEAETGVSGGEQPFVECGSCHDPHNVDNPTFLRVSTIKSFLKRILLPSPRTRRGNCLYFFSSITLLKASTSFGLE